MTLRFDVAGGRATFAHGPGSTLTKPLPAGSAAVTLTVAAVAVGSKPANAATSTVNNWPGPRRFWTEFSACGCPSRVSTRRTGDTGVERNPVGPIQPLTSTSTSVARIV